MFYWRCDLSTAGRTSKSALRYFVYLGVSTLAGMFAFCISKGPYLQEGAEETVVHRGLTARTAGQGGIDRTHLAGLAEGTGHAGPVFGGH